MIQVENLQHTFLIGKKGKEKQVPVLKGVNFEVKKERLLQSSGKVVLGNQPYYKY